jgi:hypothetical protein
VRRKWKQLLYLFPASWMFRYSCVHLAAHVSMLLWADNHLWKNHYIHKVSFPVLYKQIHGEEICAKLIYPQVVMKFPAVYDTQQFITTSATAHHFSFPCTTWIQSSH